jgi:hypothetical protein
LIFYSVEDFVDPSHPVPLIAAGEAKKGGKMGGVTPGGTEGGEGC